MIESAFLNIESLLLRKKELWSKKHIERKVLLQEDTIAMSKQDFSRQALNGLRDILYSEGDCPFSKEETQNLKVFIFQNCDLKDYHKKMFELLSRQQSLQYLLIPYMHFKNDTIAFILGHVTNCPLKCIDLTGNQLGGYSFIKVMEKLPHNIEKLGLAFNSLENQNIRDLANKITVVNVLDIRGNNSLTINVSKSFPVFQRKSQSLRIDDNFIIYHSLNWKFDHTFRQNTRCRKLKERFYRFSMTYKYHPLAEQNIENCPQFCLALELTMWFLNFIFYCLVLALPLALPTNQACSQGHQWLAHGIIAALFIVMGVFELVALIKLRQRLREKPELFGLKKFSILWKLGSSALARIDLYTDICFIIIIRECRYQYDSKAVNFGTIEIICIASIVLSLIFPFLFQVNLMSQIMCKRCRRTGVAYPRMERIARLAYSSEYKGIAAIVGSFCVDLKVRICKTERSVPRILSIYRLIFEDLIQAGCQMIFTVLSEGSNSFVLISILITVACVFASFANVFITTGAKPSRQLLIEDFPPKEPPTYISPLIQMQKSTNIEEVEMAITHVAPPDYRSERYRPEEPENQKILRRSSSILLISQEQIDSQ